MSEQFIAYLVKFVERAFGKAKVYQLAQPTVIVEPVIGSPLAVWADSERAIMGLQRCLFLIALAPEIPSKAGAAEPFVA